MRQRSVFDGSLDRGSAACRCVSPRRLSPARRRYGLKRSLSVLCFAALPIASPAARAELEPRPRLGLALGGGAARGIAHVGVLLWLEQHRIPVDSIAGTSMGALVGGAYATGMPAAEIRELLLSARWDELFRSDVPYRLETFRRKQDRRGYPIDLEVGLRNGVSLPSGLNSGHQVGLLLSRIAFPHTAEQSFDELPIPFRCVAVDIERGQQVVLADGSLAVALRATMAIPGVFAPVRRHGRLLVDGAVLDNVPVDVAREMDVDVVVAVSVGESLEEPARLSMMGLANRALVVMMEAASKPALAAADVVIEPDLEGFHSLDFRKTEALIEAGRTAAAENATRLLPFQLDEEGWAAHLESRRWRRPPPLDEATFVQVQGVPAEMADALAARLSERIDETLDLDRFEEELTRVVGSGRYESACYEATQHADERGLLVRLREKPHAPPVVNFFLDVNTEPGALVFDVGARLTLADVVGLGSEWRFDAAAGSRRGVLTELYRPVGKLRLFLAPRLFYEESSDNSFVGESWVGTYRTLRAGGGVDVGLGPGRHFELRLGYQASHVDRGLRVGSPELPETAGPEQRFEARLMIDRMSTPIIPESGLRLESSLRYYTEAPETASDFSLLRGRIVAATSMRDSDSLFAIVAGGTSLESTPPLAYRFALGGPFRLGAFAPDEFRGDHFLYGSLGYLRGITRLPDFIGGPLRLAAAVELGSAFDELPAARLKGNLTAGLVLDTVLGPVFAGASLGNRGAFNLNFSVGHPFQ